MFEKLEIVRMAQSYARHAADRMGVAARNIANADTPGYKTRDLAGFAETYRAGGATPALKTTRPGHYGGLAEARAETVFETRGGAPNGNSVSLEREMVKLTETRQQHDMALSIYRSSSNAVKAALGRGR
jgi:flagellar basal-body rod protein FlgB